MNIIDHIRVVPDFPKAGIQFYDIGTLLAHPAAWKYTIEQLAEKARAYKPDFLVGLEARGFLITAPLALELGCGFSMVRKKGKLPGETLSLDYDLEYGADSIEIQAGVIPQGARVLIIDDLLATGGTMNAAEKLMTQAGAEVAGGLCIIELDGLNGRDKLSCPFEALLNCPA